MLTTTQKASHLVSHRPGDTGAQASLVTAGQTVRVRLVGLAPHIYARVT